MSRTKEAETPEALADRAAQLRAEAGRAEAEVRRRNAEERDALAARQEAFDRALVASWDPRALDAEVEAADAALDEVLRNDPVVLAVLNLFHAQARRRFLASEVIAAHGRLGRDVSNAALPQPAVVLTMSDLVIRAVERMSAEMMTVERADLDARRNGESE